MTTELEKMYFGILETAVRHNTVARLRFYIHRYYGFEINRSIAANWLWDLKIGITDRYSTWTKQIRFLVFNRWLFFLISRYRLLRRIINSPLKYRCACKQTPDTSFLCTYIHIYIHVLYSTNELTTRVSCAAPFYNVDLPFRRKVVSFTFFI